ncbi:MAG: reverse transcriptase family protein, partial [Xenococcus sp. (in: cyanobacteria)]
MNNIDAHYKEWVTYKTDDRGQLKKYKDGTIKTRKISPSFKVLKSMQSRIRKNILEPLPLPDCIHGGVKGKSNITNAKAHQGKKYQFTTDLQSFFPGISHTLVYNTFLELGFSNHFSSWLTRLTTWNYELPQGAPTSTHIANLVFLSTDLKLIEFSNQNNIMYTRYADSYT